MDKTVPRAAELKAPGEGRELLKTGDGGESRSLSDRLYARLSRVTSSGEFIAEIDGLRFLAIAPVVVFHVRNYLIAHPVAAYATPPVEDWAARVTQHGHYGVQLFFIISGFVLALPFAKSYAGGRPVGLRRYLLKRLTRLEPPYVLVMVGSFLLLLLVRGDDASGLWPRLAAGLLYLHGAAYAEPNPVNLVAWSLEVEVQFYLLTPLLASVFAVRRVALRRALLAAACAACVVLQAAFVSEGGRLYWSLANYLQYFLAGFLLADWYLCGAGAGAKRGFAWDLVSLVGWPALVLVCERPGLARAAFAPLALLLFCAAFRGRVTNRLLTLRWVTAVGGMCYTIYLTHFQLLSAFEKAFGGVSFTESFSSNLLLHVVLFVPVLLAFAAAFFVLVEKPCMRHDWPRRLWRRFRKVPARGAADELAAGGRLAG
jgi:peptidoglycan/LPS O-acetylase OafA/YrhL